MNDVDLPVEKCIKGNLADKRSSRRTTMSRRKDTVLMLHIFDRNWLTITNPIRVFPGSGFYRQK